MGVFDALNGLTGTQRPRRRPAFAPLPQPQPMMGAEAVDPFAFDIFDQAKPQFSVAQFLRGAGPQPMLRPQSVAPVSLDPMAAGGSAPSRRRGVMGALERVGGNLKSGLAESTRDMTGQDFMRMGLGLIAAGQENDWGMAADAVGGAFDRARQRRLDDEQLGYMREDVQAARAERARTQQQTSEMDAAMEKVAATITDPTELAIFRAFPQEWAQRNRKRDPVVTQDGIAYDPATGKELYRVPDIVTEDERLARQLLQAQIAAAGRTGQEPDLPKQFGAMDAKQVYDLNVAAQAMQTTGLPQLYTLRDNIRQAIAEAQVGGAIPANGRITLDRLFNGASGNRASLETWNARILQPAIAMFAGTGPLANKELELALNAMANPNMTADAATQLIDERIRNAERSVQAAQLATRFLQENGGLTGRVDAQGRDFATFLQQTLGGGPNGPQPTQPGAPAVPGAARPVEGQVIPAEKSLPKPTPQQIYQFQQFVRLGDQRAIASFQATFGEKATRDAMSVAQMSKSRPPIQPKL